MADSKHRREKQLTEALEKSDYNLLIGQLCYNNHSELTEIKSILEHNEWILPRVCELGFIDALQQIYDMHVIDINASYLGKTGLQYASQNGYMDILTWLLDKGASLKENVWERDSEFYLATVHGRQNILDALLLKEPDLISDSDICYRLLYVACTGGHLELVKKWFTPGADVTKTPVFTSNLSACEQDYPLFAACKGEHMEVAEFLIHEGEAILTSEICNQFPAFTTRLVRSLFLKSDTKGCHFFNMSNHRIESLQSCWFSFERTDYPNADVGISNGKDAAANEEREDVFEIMINVQETNLLQMSGDILWTQKNLVSLNASVNSFETIPDAIDPSLLYLNRIKSINFSKCQLSYVSPDLFLLPCLEELNLSHNKLFTLTLREHTAGSSSRKCSKLQCLDLSHNLLQSFPLGFQVFTELALLFVSCNQLEDACTPWQCPLKYLDISYNKLRTFPPNADQFWGKTLKKLLLQHNEITELPESIVKMCALTNLDVSHNKIQQLPPSSLWRCPLHYLNLSANKLSSCENLELPSANLGSTLMELFLANNGLTYVPRSICDCERLYVLDLDNNTKIKNLPPELGKLKNLYKLKVEGIVVSDGKLQKLLSSRSNDKRDLFASKITSYLERKHKRCVYQKVVKLVVLGCKNKDGHCIIQKLSDKQNVKSLKHESMAVAEVTLKKKVKLQIWELPDTKISSTILPCFLTLNSLYLIVHDVSNCGSDLHLVSEKVSSIQAHVLSPQIIIACLNSRQLNKDELLKLKGKICDTFPKVKFISVTFGVKENFSVLRQQIYSAYQKMADVAYDRKAKVSQRQVPAKFLEVLKKVKTLNQNVCRMDEFLQAVECGKKDLDDGVDHLKLHEFLLQVGAILHYNNHVGELSDLVILNPAWLFEILSKFLKSLTSRNHSKTAQLPLSSVRDKFKCLLPEGAHDYFPAILKLMEFFNIGLRLTDCIRERTEISLLIPSLLPKQPPQCQVYAHENTLKASRLYRLPVIPPALWSHLISQLILVFGRLSSSKWKFGNHLSHTSFPNDISKSFMKTSKLCDGLHIINKKIQYWRSGIMIYHNEGHVVVEEVDCRNGTEDSEPGILVTVQTSGTTDLHGELQQQGDNKKYLSVMGIVVDEIEEILELFNPNFRDPTNAYSNRIYALCPLCYNIVPGTRDISLAGIHFLVGDCAQVLLERDAITCQSGPSSLHCLVPELLFMELPSEMHVSAPDLVVTDVVLGHGMTGAVTKATYKGAEVAVKLFYEPTISPSVESNTKMKYSNIKDTDQMVVNKRSEVESEQRKLTLAFSNVRREVGILSKLRHEFIVKFIGVCMRPQLLLVMELAPYGSLRAEIERRTNGTCMDGEQKDRVITQTVFSKDLTYKIVLQIGCGLCYLHKNSIIYRDLKPDNILVMSLALEDKVNIKLSDYGISKFNTLQGVKGLFGTVGYMAPEVVSKQFYNEKADIYSYGIVMLEIHTGLPPSGHLRRPHWSNLSYDDAVPDHIQGYQIHACFPYLENLMKECYSLGMEERPSSEDIVKEMKSEQFLLLHDSITLDRNSEKHDSIATDRSSQENLEITCVYVCQTNGRWKIWISESGQGSHRCISVYDIESSRFSVYRKVCPGPPIIGMAKVGFRIWIINKENNCLNIIERGHESSFEISSGASLDSRATKILNHSYGSLEESKSIILVGLENGCLTMFHFSASNNTSVTAISNISIEINVPVADMCSCRDDLLTVACGMTVYFQQVGLPDNQGINETKISKGTWIPKLISSGSVSLTNVIDGYHPVAAITADGNTVWCCLEGCSLVLKVDSDLKQVVLVLTISWNSVLDTVRIEEGKALPESSVMLGASGSGVVSEALKLNKHQISRDNDNDPETNDQKVYNEIDSDLGTGSKSITLPRRKTTSTVPELPPGRNILEKAISMPELDTTPPFLPKRRGYQNVNISITSLRLATDILVIGTTGGAIVLLPLTYSTKSGTSGNPPSLPFLLPVLKHSGARKSGQGLATTESISTLMSASDKLVSLYSTHSHVLRHRQSTRSDSYIKRRGVFLNPESLSNSQCHSGTDTSDTRRIREGGFFNSESNSHCHSGTETNNINTSASSHIVPSQSTSSSSTASAMDLRPNVCDIAVWDTVTCNRLKTIRSYGHSLIDCSGWCCRAPVPVSDT